MIVNFECDFKFVGAKLPSAAIERATCGVWAKSCGNDRQSPSKWVAASRPCGNILCHYQRIRRRGRGGKGRDVKRETFRFSRICSLSCGILRMFWERSDGYWICAELDMRVTNVIVFSPQPPTGGVSQARQRRTNMASIRGAVNTSRAALYSLLLCHTRSGCVTSWRHN